MFNKSDFKCNKVFLNKKNKLKIKNINYLSLLMASIWWIVPLLMLGTFDDGVFYASISRNLVYEPGTTIWDLKVANFLDPAFNGHPPFAFWLQALFFAVLGDWFWVERFYSLCCAAITAYLLWSLAALFRRDTAPLAVFFWLLIPLVGWSYANNMLENTLSPLAAGAVYLLLKQRKENKKSLLVYWFTNTVAALLIFAATLTKGPVGLFPAAIPLVWGLVMDRKKLHWYGLQFLLLMFFCGLFYLLLFYFDERALLFFKVYWQLQLENSLSGSDYVSANRFELVKVLFEETLIINSLILLAFLLGRRLKKEPINWPLFWLWLLIAFSASLPMLISPKQLGFYLVPSFMFYALALATLATPLYKAWGEELKQFVLPLKIFKITLVSGILFCWGLSIYNIGRFARTPNHLSDVFRLGELLPHHQEIFLSPDLYRVWSFHGLMYRHFYIDLSTVYQEQEYALFYRESSPHFSEEKYEELPVQLNNYKLYRRKNPVN